jgi:hypothetical protein
MIVMKVWRGEDISLDILIEVDGFNPGRAAPQVYNPSAPGFSDPGEGCSYEVTKITIERAYNSWGLEIDVNDPEVIEALEGKPIDLTASEESDLDEKLCDEYNLYNY